MQTSNNNVSVGVSLLPHFKGALPSYESLGASGMDVRAQLEKAIVLAPGSRALIPTGLCLEIPENFEIQVRARSGWAAKKGIAVLNGPGTIDADYRGEVKILLANLGEEPVEISDQDRVAQLVLAPVYRIRWEKKTQLEESDRGIGGFGSTGLA